MPRLRALNESSSDESEEENDERETIEAQEDRAFSLYKKALELRQRGNYPDAEELLISILSDDFLANVAPGELSDGPARPAAALKYACLKNLGNVLVLQNRAEDGLKCFILAVELDGTDVTMWYQMGKVALQIDDFQLASRAFQEGLRCNSRHWPCLDSLMPLLYALNDYLGCLLLVSRSLELDAEYPQALALRHQISKEDKNLIQNFKLFFPEEKDISEVFCDIPDEELSSLTSHALSLQERYRLKVSAQPTEDVHKVKIAVNLQSNTWENLGKNLLEVYKSISCSQGKSFLQLVEINALDSSIPSAVEPIGRQNSIESAVENIAPSGVTEFESEPMDVDSEHEAKGEDQTEEDATEASGLEQDEEAKASTAVQQSSLALKQKRKKSSTTLMDQWSKRRSGRRTGRRAEDREESNLASCFRSLLPDSLLPKDLEAELAKASRRRSLRDTSDILSWGDDSMDTMELCRLLQERDAKDDQKRKIGLHAKDMIPKRIQEENYFGTAQEVSEVLTMVLKCGSNNIVQLVVKFIKKLANKHTLTWPPGLVPIYVELYECMRKHVPCPSPFDSTVSSSLSMIDLLEALLYCELNVDMWHQKSLNESDILGENGLAFSEALGNVTVLSGLSHLFTSPSEQCKILLRIHWLKAHLFLLQEDSASAIFSLQDVLDSLEIVEIVDSSQSTTDVSLNNSKKVTSNDVPNKSLEEEKVEGKCQNEGNLNESEVENPHISNQVVESVTVDNDNVSNDVEMPDVTEEKSSPLAEQPVVDELITNNSSPMNNEPILEELTTNSSSPQNLQPALNEETANKSSPEADPPVLDEETANKSSPGVDPPGLDELTANKSSPGVDPPGLDELTANKSSPGADPPVLDEETANKSSPVADPPVLDEETAINSSPVVDLPVLGEMIITNTSPVNVKPSSEELTTVEPRTERTENFTPPLPKLEKEDCDGKNLMDTSLPIKEEKMDEMEADTEEDALTVEPSRTDSRDISEEMIVEPFDIPEAVVDGDGSKEPVSETLNQEVLKVEETDQDGSKKQENVDLPDPKEIESKHSQPIDADMPSGALKSNCGSEQSGSSSGPTAKVVPFIVVLPNCSFNQEITKRATQKLLTSLTRQQQLSEIDDLYQSGHYELLAGTLTECFQFCAQQTDNDGSEIDNLPDRATQMAMLLDCFWQLKKYPDCFYWGEACLHEAFNRYLNSSDSADNASLDQDDRQMWATSVERLLAGLNECLKTAGLKLMEKLPKNCLTRLVQTLTTILCQQLEQSDSSVEMAIECTTPWVILHRIVYYEEQQHPLEQDCVPSHMSILFTAHEYMARKNRCCLNEGILLNLILDVVVAQLQSEELKGVRNQLSHEVDQAILCLYGHPKKPVERNKKKIQDHKVHQQIELTWDRSLALLRFYEPDELPTYDSISKISPEEEQLFLKISQLIPAECSPNRHLGKVKAFLKGSTDTVPEVHCALPQAARNLYYLLANYYMKTFKWEPAIKYYMLDVCLNPYRFDSWAAMALARAASLTSDLNSCDTFDNDVQLHRKTKAQRCFQQAVNLEPENTTMWIEFGSFAYTVHSFCSRLLKTETDSLSMEMFTKIEEEKDKMLSLTEQCFKTVEKLDQEEPWLPQYMLGKVAEKRGEAPLVFLQHYRAAAKLLFDSNAEYPLSLNYEPTQHYAYEAHEVHYRIHASILKHLEIMEGKPLNEEVEFLYKETLDEAAKGPFMASRGTTQPALAKRQSVDPIEYAGKRMKLDELVQVSNLIAEQDTHQTKVDLKDVAGSSSISQSNSNMEATNCGQETDPNKSENSPVPFNGQAAQIDLSKKDDSPPVTQATEKMETDCEIISGNSSSTSAVEGKPDRSPLKETESESCQTSQVLVGAEAEANGKEANLAKREQGTSGSVSPSSHSSNSEMTNTADQSGKDNVNQKSNFQDSSKESRDVIPVAKPVVERKSLGARSLDHADLVHYCLVAMEECLSRYPRHYKSFYRLCHHYFRSKQHRNLKKCRQLLLGDNRLPQSNKNISGLFKSSGVHAIFNDVWRIPVEEIDRAGSFASHMSRCVHLLMELLRALRDHSFLLKLSVFLKRDPEKKDKKYLRDNERADLSKQALVLCLAAMRESVNESRSVDHVIELYRTVKEGIKELPLKEAAFKGLLSDAYRKVKGLSKDQGEQQSCYEVAIDFCLKELNSRKAIADAKAKALSQQSQVHPQMQMQAQAQAQAQAQVQAQVHDQLQAQVLAQAMQMGVMSSTLPFNATQGFPAVVNTPLRNPLADARANAMASAMVNSMASSLASSMASSMFLPQMPLYRGRGRPPKAQQRLHNAMMNMAHMMGLANVPPSGQNVMEASKPKTMKQQQKQRRTMPGTGAQTTVVSSIMKDRPALSITALQGSKTTTQSAGTASTPTPPPPATAPMRTSSPFPLSTLGISDVSTPGQPVWQQRPRHSAPRPTPGATDPRSMLNASMARKEGPRFKGPTSSTGAPVSQPPKTYTPPLQSNNQLNNPAALLSRLPGLQIKQRSHPTSPHSQETLSPRPIEKPPKVQAPSGQGQTSKPALSISKVSASSSQSAPGSSTAENLEANKSADPNFDIITLD